MNNRVGAASLNLIPAHITNNKSVIIDVINAAKKSKIAFLCLPELAISGYGCEDIFYSKSLLNTSLDSLNEIIKHTDNTFITLGLPISYENKTYNAIAIVYDKKLLGIYCKKHLANEGLYYEKRWFDSWENGKVSTLKIFDNEVKIGDIIINIPLKGNENIHGCNIKIGFEICEDAWVSDKERELMALAKKGEQLNMIFNPSASHFQQYKHKDRKELILESSKKLNTTYVYANHLGNEAGQIVYDGDTYIAKSGVIIKEGERLSFKPYQLCYTDVDLFNNQGNNIGELPPPASHSKDDLHNIEFMNATILGMYDYLRKSGSRGFVLSLSGGADSSICAVLVSEMVKKGVQQLGVYDFLVSIIDKTTSWIEGILKIEDEQQQIKAIICKLLITVYQKTVNNSEETYLSARELSAEIGATFYKWDVDRVNANYIKMVESVTNRDLNENDDDIALQNIQARSRVPGVWLITNINNFLLISTSNRSEGSVGYCTMDGDTAGSLAPIACIDKNFIQQWLRWAEYKLGYSELKRVNSLEPSAELRAATNTSDTKRIQRDEDDLMPYKLLQKIEELAFRDWKDPIEIYEIIVSSNGMQSYDKDFLISSIIKFFGLWRKNQWKRKRLAPSLYIGEYSNSPSNYLRFPIFSNSYERELKQLTGML